MRNSKSLVLYNVFSSLQLLNFLSFYMQNNESYNKVIIFMGRSILDTIDDKYIELCFKLKVEIRFDDFNNFSFEGNFFDVVFVSRVNFYFWIKHYRNSNFKKIIIIDDGISNYCNNFHVIKASLRESGGGGLLRFLITLSLNKFLYFFNRNNIITYGIFNKESLKINEDYKKSFINVLKMINRERAVDERGVVFCTQPLVDLGLITEEKYIEDIFFIQSKIKAIGYNFYIKKHPKEKLVDYRKYNIPIIEFNGVVEEFFLKNRFYAVISNCSTSSILIPALFDVKSYTYNTKVLRKSGFLINQLFIKYCNELDELIFEEN